MRESEQNPSALRNFSIPKAESPLVRIGLLKGWAPEAELAGRAHGSERRKAPKMRVPAARHPLLGVQPV